MRELKKKLLYITLFFFTTTAYLVDLLSTPYYLGVWAVLSIWFWIPISDEKRCEDCKKDHRYASCMLCNGHAYYARKRWKFWRPK